MIAQHADLVQVELFLHIVDGSDFKQVKTLFRPLKDELMQLVNTAIFSRITVECEVTNHVTQFTANGNAKMLHTLLGSV
jgi:hypothetical protein